MVDINDDGELEHTTNRLAVPFARFSDKAVATNNAAKRESNYVPKAGSEYGDEQFSVDRFPKEAAAIESTPSLTQYDAEEIPDAILQRGAMVKPTTTYAPQDAPEYGDEQFSAERFLNRPKNAQSRG